MDINENIFEIPNLLNEEYYAKDLFQTTKYVSKILCKKIENFDEFDDKAIEDFKTLFAQKSVEPNTDEDCRVKARKWFFILDDVQIRRRKHIEQLQAKCVKTE